MDRQAMIDEAIEECSECGRQGFSKRADCDGCTAAVDEEIAAALSQESAHARDKLDAARGRALVGSGRIRILGTAGFDPTSRYAFPGHYHFGAEFWSTHSEPTANGAAIVTQYADMIIKHTAGIPTDSRVAAKDIDDAWEHCKAIPSNTDLYDHLAKIWSVERLVAKEHAFKVAFGIK